MKINVSHTLTHCHPREGGDPSLMWYRGGIENGSPPSRGRQWAWGGRCARGRQYGFTLLEILVALAVFAILATITSTAMYQAFNTRTKVTMQADQLSHLQLAMAFIRRDTQQIIERSVHGNEFHLFPPFTGQPNYIEFTRGGDINALGSTLKRVAYLCRHGQFIRRSWERLDTPNRKQFHDRVLLENLSQCSFAYLTHNLQILADWHEFEVKPNQRQETLPTAVKLTLNLKSWGHMSELFIIPEALYVE